MPTNGLSIERVQQASEELVGAFARLGPQLSSAPPAGLEALRRVVSSPGTVLLVARAADGSIVGTCTLVTFEIPTGVRAWLEDVVVDGAVRGGGIGATLVEAALEAARAAGARTVDLTSRPSREAANRLYERSGFARRETNVWRREL